jgi:hypothetical protein
MYHATDILVTPKYTLRFLHGLHKFAYTGGKNIAIFDNKGIIVTVFDMNIKFLEAIGR